MTACKSRKDQIQGCCCDDDGKRDITGIKVGNEKMIDVAANAIIGILTAQGAEQETKMKALDTLSALCSIKNVAITGNYITIGEGEKAHQCQCGKDK